MAGGRKRRDFARLAGVAFAGVATSAHAQQPLPVLGFLSSRSAADSVDLVAAVKDGLRSAGLIEGQNMSIEYRWADADYGRLPNMAKELVQQRVTAILSVGGDAPTKAAMQATSSIPIVFGSGSDP